MSIHSKEHPPYSILAELYDTIMSDVDYETWADYIDEIIMTHHPDARHLLELACGTGTVALSLEELDCYDITATDASKEMIGIAKSKGAEVNSEIRFEVMDFRNIHLSSTFDVIFLIFDSINYLHHEDEILKLHRDVKEHLAPDGIFIYDFTTPRNSRKAIEYLNIKKHLIGDKYQYKRASSYDSKNRIHTNVFEIEVLNKNLKTGKMVVTETHKQKIYTEDDIRSIIEKSGFTILEAYDGFQLLPAHKNSLRITMVLK